MTLSPSTEEFRERLLPLVDKKVKERRNAFAVWMMCR
jgi:hypothetical protein